MNSQQARALVTETFPQTFDKGRFHHFVKELLNGFDESKAAPMAVPDAFAPHVRSCSRLGTYESPDGELADVLIVNTTEPWKLERTRTALRDFVAHKLKRGDSYKEAGLVAFVAPDASSWRFSFVRMEYESKRDPKTGKIAVEERLTPARRFSYIVGENESCHTAQSRFLDLLQDTETKPPLAKIEEAFSVETVTEEFFRQYKELFLGLKDELDKLAKKDPTLAGEFAEKKVTTEDFAKKLMGQIVFLYFLQKKGWLGVPKGGDWGDGPHNFLRQLFDGHVGQASSLSPNKINRQDARSTSNFFNDILEPLFYDTLATDRGHDAWCKIFNCRIPFLNGGLFEPLHDYDWKKTDIIIPDELFSNNKRTKDDTGTGILDVFDRYNFTVNEAEPLEKEVAIDPEMLGKVFENLLEVKERKSKGSFYTPREIVHYMCQESLINYLDTTVNGVAAGILPDGQSGDNSKGRENPGADPDGKMPPSTAGGTPAATLIPRANLETFIHSGDQASHFEAARVEGTDYKRRLPRTIEDHARLLDDKLADIAVCDPAIGSGAFPVGMMQEIVRARSALTPYFNDVHERTAYHFKRHAIQNCLYGVDIDPGAVEIAKLRLWLSLVVDEDDVKQIKPLPNLDYKIVTGNSLLGVEKNLFNVDLFKRLEELKPRYFDATDRQQKEKFKHEIDDLIHELTNGKEAFDFEIYFSEVMDKKRRGGFDAVIGNPPYVRQEAIKDFKPALKAEGYECFDGVADLLVYFYERGVKLLRGGGTIALITSNKFYRAGYGEKLRGFLTRELTLHRLIDFGDAPVFEAIAYASILAGVRAAPARDASALAYTWEKEMAFDRIAQIVPERGQQIRQSELKPDGWQLESPAVFRLLKKLRRAGKPLGELPRTAFFNGIKTGLNPAFVLSRTERDAIVSAEPEAATLFKPFLRGRDVKRWRVQSADLWLLYLPWHFPLHSDGTIRTSSAEAEKAFKAQFPIVHKHLKRFSESLRKRDASEVGVRYEWYVLSRPRFESAPQFAKPKVVIPTIVNDVEYAVDREGYFSNDKTTLLACENPEFITALLNSKPLFWFMRQTAAQKQGGFYEFKPMYVSALPIPAVPSEQQKPVERLVERILSAKQRDAGADVSAWERELDEWVYALYGLTPEEIKLVEGQTK